MAAVGLALAAPEGARADIDSEHLFGFTEGTDIGRKGERELELEAHGRFHKGHGHYAAISPGAEGKFTVLDHVRISPTFSIGHHSISGIPGMLDHRGSNGLETLGLETKVRLLDRTTNPVGVTVGVTPTWSRLDGGTGEAVNSYGTSFLFSADRELVANNMFVAFNATYDLAATQTRATQAWSHDSAFGISGALATRAFGNVFFGGEVRYAEAHGGLGLDHFSGRALFVGPTFYSKLTETVWVAAGWNIQVAGRESVTPGRLDLVNFEKHEVAVRVGIAF